MDEHTIGSRVKRLRMNHGLKQGELAKASGVSLRTISKIETGVTDQPHPDTMKHLADALDVTVPELTGVSLESAEQRIFAAIRDLDAKVTKLLANGSE